MGLFVNLVIQMSVNLYLEYIYSLCFHRSQCQRFIIFSVKSILFSILSEQLLIWSIPSYNHHHLILVTFMWQIIPSTSTPGLSWFLSISMKTLHVLLWSKKFGSILHNLSSYVNSSLSEMKLRSTVQNKTVGNNLGMAYSHNMFLSIFLTAYQTTYFCIISKFGYCRCSPFIKGMNMNCE